MPDAFDNLAAAGVPQAGTTTVEARFHAGPAVSRRVERVADEIPVAIAFGGVTYAVMLATPLDIEDFATGFALTEGLVPSAAAIGGLRVTEASDGIVADMAVSDALFDAMMARRRQMMAGTGCGRCGTGSFAEALRPLPPLGTSQQHGPEAIRRAVAALPALQPLNRSVGAVHAAAFADAAGTILAVREDVGRHNALDKLVGHLARTGADPEAGFVVVSSRTSFEMVHKTAAAGIPLIASVSAPTSLAIRAADAMAVGLAAFVRDQRLTVYASPGRISGV